MISVRWETLFFAIGSPTGRANEVRPPLPPRARVPQIANERHPFMKRDEDGIVGAKRLHQAIAARQIVAFGDEGAEDAVPNDEDAAIVMVEIFGIGGVVHAMMRGGVEDVYEPAELRNPFRVQPELIEEVQRDGDEHRARLETEPDQRHVEDRRPGQPPGPAKAVCRSKIELIRGMMDRMCRPEPPNPVAAAMEPVVAEILADQERNHRDSGVDRYREEAVIVSQIVRRRREAERKERQYDVLA